MSEFVISLNEGLSNGSETSGHPALQAKDMILPVLLQYIVICILLEYRYRGSMVDALFTQIVSFHRGMVRGKHTIGRASSLFFLSSVILATLLLFNHLLGYPKHDPILVMRLLRPIVVSIPINSIQLIDKRSQLLIFFSFGLACNIYVWDRHKLPWHQMFQTGADSKVSARHSPGYFVGHKLRWPEKFLSNAISGQ